jgi:hypothetical protein
MIIELPLPIVDSASIARDGEGRPIIDLSDQPLAVCIGVTRLVKVRAEEDAVVRDRVAPVLLMPPEFGIELKVSDTDHELNGLWVREELLHQLVSRKSAVAND